MYNLNVESVVSFCDELKDNDLELEVIDISIFKSETDGLYYVNAKIVYAFDEFKYFNCVNEDSYFGILVAKKIAIEFKNELHLRGIDKNEYILLELNEIK